MQGDQAVVNVVGVGMHTLGFKATDNASNTAEPQIVEFEIVAQQSEEPTGPPDPPDGVLRIAGADRYATAVAASQHAFPAGATAVVVATGENWPDALGGSALAGVVDGPLLLTPGSVLPSTVAEEIERLGATRAYVLGGTAAVSEEVTARLTAMLGGENVQRIAGTDRFSTARAVADMVIELQGADFDGRAVLATGLGFADALAASPLAARQGWPVLLANPAAVAPVALPPQVTKVSIAGGTAAIPAPLESALAASLGRDRVVRHAGTDRYETAIALAAAGVEAGMRWDGVGIAAGEAFADALSGGAMVAAFDAPLLLTPCDVLHVSVSSALHEHAADIHTVHIVGGTAAVAGEVGAAIGEALGL